MIAILDRRATSGGRALSTRWCSARRHEPGHVSGKKPPRLTADAARYLFTPRAGLVNWTGGATHQTSEGTPINTLSPAALADASRSSAPACRRRRRGRGSGSARPATWSMLLRADQCRHRLALPQPAHPWRAGRAHRLPESRIDAHQGGGDLDAHGHRPARQARGRCPAVFAGAADCPVAAGQSEARAQTRMLTAYLVNEVNYNET
jgi:hypothetical protein